MSGSEGDKSNGGENPPERVSTLSLVSWAFYDWASNAYATVILTFLFAPYFVRRVVEDETAGTAQWGLLLGVTGLVVAVGAPVLGATIDQSGRRKPWIAVFTLLCVTATALLWFVKPSPEYLLLAVLLVALGELGSEYANVLYNAMLPTLVSRERLGRWSGWGWSMGYAGGLLCLVVTLLALVREEAAWLRLDQDEAQPVRAAFVFAAGWFLLFAIPLMLFTPDSPSTGKRLGRAARNGLRQLGESIRHVRQYANIVRFLIARILFIDGLATVFAFGGVYATGTFDMNEPAVLAFGIAINVTAGLGALAFSWVDDWIGGKNTILISLAGLITTALMILLVESLAWFWTFGLLLGIFVGPVQAASRSFLARVAPEPLRNQMFGLYAFSGKAAFLCPLLVGGLTYLTDSQRIGMTPIIVFFAIGFLLMLTVSD